MAQNYDSTYQKNIQVTQVGWHKDGATVRISYSLVNNVYNLYGLKAIVNGDNVQNNIQKVSEVGAYYTYNNGIIRQYTSGGTHLATSVHAWPTKILSSGTWSKDVYVSISRGGKRSGSKWVTGGIHYISHSDDPNYTGDCGLTIYTSQIAAPSTPTLTKVENVDGNGKVTSITLTATVPSNPESFYKLSIEDITGATVELASDDGGTSVEHTVTVDEAYYDKTHSYRARIVGDDIDKRSSTKTVFVKKPMDNWYYYDNGGNKKKVIALSYYDDDGNKKRVNTSHYNNGGIYVK